MRKIVVLFAVLFVAFAFTVLAAGSGGGGTRVTKPAQPETPKEQPLPGNCEDISTLRERISCRLKKGNDGTTTEESCRVLANPASCIALYNQAEPCYALSDGREKDKCFKRIAQFSHVTVKQEKNEKGAAPVKDYLILLLYELQNRVEDSQGKGKISADAAAGLIGDIIEAKQAVLGGKSKAEIKSRIAVLKQDWGREMA